MHFPYTINLFQVFWAVVKDRIIFQSCKLYDLANEDPSLHISNFLEICDTFKQNGVTEDTLRLRLFPFSSKDKAKTWLISMPTESIRTWNQMTK